MKFKKNPHQYNSNYEKRIIRLLCKSVASSLDFYDYKKIIKKFKQNLNKRVVIEVN